MLIHYIRIAIRNLAKQKVLTFINISGLSLGLACFSLILLFAVNEFSYDRFRANAAHIYRIDEVWTRDDGSQQGEAGLYIPLAPAMKKEFPDVKEVVRFSPENQYIVKAAGHIFRLPMIFADPNALSVFSFPLLAGKEEQALKDAHSIVLTQSRAKQLFGSWDVVGKTIEVKIDTSYQLFTVSAVAEDIPANTTLSFDLLGSYEYLLTRPDRQQMVDSWHQTHGDKTYVLLRPDSRLMNEPQRLRQFRMRHYPEEAADYRKDKKVRTAFVLQPLRRLHTTTNVDAGPPGTTTDPRNIWILLAIASGIVLIASINFTTLAIARSARRAKEVGVRRVVGGLRRQLIVQFLTESVLLSTLSAGMGCLLAYMLLPWFSQLSGRSLEFSFTRFPELAWMLGGLALLVGLLAGCYPALVLSGFNPVNALKTKIRLGGANFFTRSLVTFQFVLSIGLIVGTIIILRQVSFMRHKDLGLIKENTIVVDARDARGEKSYRLFRETLQSSRLIKGIAASSTGLGEGQGEMGFGFNFNGKETGVIIYPVDSAFLRLMGVQLIAGRNFDPTITADTVNSIIVNETLVKNVLGINPSEAIGLQCKSGRSNYETIIGVTRDFNFEPLNRQVRAQAFMMDGHFELSHYFIRVAAGDPGAAIAAIGTTWKKVAPDIPLRYSFLDENLDRFYKSEARWGSIIACAGGISIFLACLGLFGLAALAAANRVKEVGIRKVLGASTFEIVRLLTGGFLRLVLLSSLIASPMAWLVMNRWLRDFAYRIDIGWMVFALTASIALLIAALTIGLQAMRSARANPVGNLRSE
jgi:putative ABC transport system permease protein